MADPAAEVQVAAGKTESAILKAIQWAEKGTTGEIRVHITRRWWEPDALKRAQKLFESYGMYRTAERNGVLLYVNLRKKKFAVIGDTGIQAKIGQSYWDDLAKSLREDLLSTHYENAIAFAVRTLGVTLKMHFPVESGAENPNELPDLVTED